MRHYGIKILILFNYLLTTGRWLLLLFKLLLEMDNGSHMDMMDMMDIVLC